MAQWQADRGLLVDGEREVEFRSNQYILMNFLADGKFHSTTRVYDAVYENRSDSAMPNNIEACVSVALWKMRQKLKPFGHNIRNYHGRGWQLVPPLASIVEIE